MPKTYKTSKNNRTLVTDLTRILSLGHENHIARIGLMYSLKNHEPSTNEIYKIKDSGGKEYSTNVLFGEYEDLYKEVTAYCHNIAVNDPKIDFYIKYHLDRGIELLAHLIIEEQTAMSLEEFVEGFCL